MANNELKAQLKAADIEFDEIIFGDLSTLVHDLDLGGEDLVNEWLAYQYKHDTECIDQSSFKTFSTHLRSQSCKMGKKTRPFIHNSTSLKPLRETRTTPTPNTNINTNDLMNKYLAMRTPSKSSTKSALRAQATPTVQPLNIHQSPVPTNPCKSRKKRGESIHVLNENIARNNNIKRISIHFGDETQDSDKRYRFMNENTYLKQNTIRDRISLIGTCLMQQIKNEHGNDNDNDIAYCGIQDISQRACYYLGRIMNDGDNVSSDKITAGNIVLHDEFGTSIKLDISSLKSVSLFPGQIVAIKGVNSSGKEINVERIYQNAYIMNLNKNKNKSIDDGVLQMMIGCGPFTAQNSLEFNGSPFHDFAQIVVRHKPNIVLLMGPFTDTNNELIKSNEINCTFHELFEHLLTSFVRFIPNDTKVIVTPSTKDIHHFTAFPQRKYTMQSGDIPHNVYFSDNPCEFQVNNVSFGVCSADFIWDCCKIGFTQNIKDRLLSIVSHCIDQQNFYPLEPASRSLRMDYNHYQQLYMTKKLDVLVMPSNLKQFAKIYENTICINPSYLTRLNRGGSYAVLNIHKSNDYNVTNYSNLVGVDILRM